METEWQKTLSKFDLNGKTINYYSLPKLEKQGYNISRLPFSVRVVLESLLRNLDGKSVKDKDVMNIANWDPSNPNDNDVPFKVSRVLMQHYSH
ncbi:hypothetical protein M1137_03380 [Candidatus Parvarchaeota archaeon]|nr:hypothetical protein [Candidatus Parvarchaeota archaeon]